MRNDFTLFLREIPGGKKVYYYYTYDHEGQRRGPWTTKCNSKTAARNYCHALLKKGNLIPDRRKAITFGKYAEGFWVRGAEYVMRQESRREITDSYLFNCNINLNNQILPFFKDTPLNKITEKDVNDWLLGFKKRKVIKNGKEEIFSYQNTYANVVFGTFNVMLEEAVRRGLIPANPCEKVLRLRNDRKKLEILNVEEVQKLFPKNYKTIWGNREVHYIANRLASLTGMRVGEVLGLRGEYIFDNYIQVCGQYGTFGYTKTKTKENRNIPLLPEMIGLLRKLMAQNSNGYLFSVNGGATPVDVKSIRKAFHNALIKIGIDKNEIKRRGLTFHTWRHFLNTELQRQGLTIQQVQSVTGHKSVRMSDWYSHIDARQITDVVKAQEVISGKKPAKEGKPSNKAKANNEKSNSKGLKIVKTSNRKIA